MNCFRAYQKLITWSTNAKGLLWILYEHVIPRISNDSPRNPYNSEAMGLFSFGFTFLTALYLFLLFFNVNWDKILQSKPTQTDFEGSLDQSTSWPFKDKIGDIQWYDITTRQLWHMHLDNMLQLIRCIFYRKCPPPTHFRKKGKNCHHCRQNTTHFIFLNRGKQYWNNT